MSKDRCHVRYCRGEVAVTCMGKAYCEKHWEEKCEREDHKIDIALMKAEDERIATLALDDDQESAVRQMLERSDIP